MYPARDTLQHVIKAWWKVVWQKSGKTLPVFFFANEHNNTNTSLRSMAVLSSRAHERRSREKNKSCSRPNLLAVSLPSPALISAPNKNRHATQATQTRSLELKTILKVIPEEKQQLVQEKDANNVRKVLCKSFLHWFWELNLWSYKCRVDCFGSFRLFDLLLLLKWKSRNMTKKLNVRSLGKPVSFVFPRVLMIPSGLSGKQNYTCFPRDLTLKPHIHALKKSTRHAKFLAPCWRF